MRRLAAALLLVLCVLAVPHGRARAQFNPATMGGMVPPAWTPLASSPYFVLDPSKTSTLTIATGVSQATNAAGGALALVQATGTQQPTLDNTQPLGRIAQASGLKFVATASQGIVSATGGITGHADHSICVVGQQDLSSDAYNSWALFGATPGGAGATSNLGDVGTGVISPGQWWAARGSGPGTPYSASPFRIDTYPHLLCLVFASQTISLWVDGLLAINSVSDTSYNLSAGFGINAFYTGYYPTAHIWYGGWYTSAITAATRHAWEAWASSRFQVGSVACLGDSICAGYHGSQPNAALAYLSSQYLTHGANGSIGLNFGVIGQRTDQILARVSSITGVTSAANKVPFITMVNGGINDAYQSLTANAWQSSHGYAAPICSTNGGNLYCTSTNCTSGAAAPTCTSGTCSDGACTWSYYGAANSTPATAAVAVANLQSIASALRAAGSKVLVYQMTPVGAGTFATYTASAAAYQASLNASINANAGEWHDGALPLTTQPELTSSYSCWFNADNVHPSTTAACTCPLSNLGAWAALTSYTVPVMVKNAGVYYAAESSCMSGATAPTCTSGTCSDGGTCTWDAIPAGADCTVSGYQVIARAALQQAKALLGM